MDSKLASVVVSVALTVHCVAQRIPPELASRIEQRIRVSESIPATVRILVSSPHRTNFAGYHALSVTFEDNGRREDGEFLLSDDGEFLVKLTRLDLTKNPYIEIMGRITLGGRPIRGNGNHKVEAVLFDDFECPFCARVHQTLFPEMLKEYGERVTFVYKDFPLSKIHPWATHAAVNANCLAAQNSEAYWDFTDYIHANQQIVNADKEMDKQFAALDGIALHEGARFGVDTKKLQSCLTTQDDRAVKGSVKEGEALGVTGTPTIFVNGEKLEGAVSASELRAAFDRAIQDSDARKTPASQR
jgi:protein-disulfide isomerase